MLYINIRARSARPANIHGTVEILSHPFTLDLSRQAVAHARLGGFLAFRPSPRASKFIVEKNRWSELNGLFDYFNQIIDI